MLISLLLKGVIYYGDMSIDEVRDEDERIIILKGYKEIIDEYKR